VDAAATPTRAQHGCTPKAARLASHAEDSRSKILGKIFIKANEHLYAASAIRFPVGMAVHCRWRAEEPAPKTCE
jgi:hypothetical protein